jgi:hypothetical protein
MSTTPATLSTLTGDEYADLLAALETIGRIAKRAGQDVSVSLTVSEDNEMACMCLTGCLPPVEVREGGEVTDINEGPDGEKNEMTTTCPRSGAIVNWLDIG